MSFMTPILITPSETWAWAAPMAVATEEASTSLRNAMRFSC